MRRGFHHGLPTRLRNASFGLFAGGILAYGAAFAWYMLDRFDLVNLIHNANFDDSFYYFQIAWRLAGGEFSTFDGGLTRTNGYHPLWLFLITPFYWVFDKTEALFAIKAFEVMLVAGGVALVAGAARAARLPWILLFAALPALYRNTTLFGGLEAAAALFMLGLFLLAVCLFARDPARWRWPLAAAAFALPWARLEYVAVAMAATAAAGLLEWSWRDGPERPSPGDRARAGVPFLAAAAGLLAYFAYNAAVFGGIVPVSGATKRWWSLRFWEQEGGYSLTENVRAFLQTGYFDDELRTALEVCVYVVVVWWFSRRTRGRDDRLLLAFLVGVFGLAAGHLAKFAHNVLTVTVTNGSPGWYFVPAYLMGALAVPARCYVAIWFVRRVLGPGLRRGSSLGIVAAGAVFLFATTDFAAPFRFVDSRRTNAGEWMVAAYSGTMAMNRVLPEDSVVGSWDAGVVGYFSRFPVMNLDGLVNSWDYLRAQKEGTEAAFRQRRGITHLANFQFSAIPGGEHYDTRLFEGPRFLVGEAEHRFMIWPAEPRTSPGGVGVRRGVDRSDLFRERIEPHLERQADGVGLLVDGRLAQAFAWDCAPDELVVWTSGPAGRVETAGAWTRTSIGYCVNSIVLPHDAVPPVRAAAMAMGDYLADRVGERRPAIRSDFDVYLAGNRLVYVKEPCGPEDVEAGFYLHVVPADPDDLPGSLRRHGQDNLDFRFDDRGLTFDGVCVAGVPLPEYGIAEIRTGQGRGGLYPWGGEIRLGPDRAETGERLADRVRGRRPAIESDFSVHLVGNTLIYVKERCGADDVDAPFFLHVVPVDPDDLAGPRGYGFDDLDFGFAERGATFDGACLVEVPLPEYAIAAIRTGQVVAVEGGDLHLWEGEIRPYRPSGGPRRSTAQTSGPRGPARLRRRRPFNRLLPGSGAVPGAAARIH